MEEQKQEPVFADGFIYKLPRAEAPEFVKGSVSVKVEEFAKFMTKYAVNGWLNLDLKVGKSGKPYAQLNTWIPSKPETKETPEEMPDSDMPF